ncbi:hypothetical protein V1511DRAFT_486320 [Dipodascopsis uninucleata]
MILSGFSASLQEGLIDWDDESSDTIHSAVSGYDSSDMQTSIHDIRKEIYMLSYNIDSLKRQLLYETSVHSVFISVDRLSDDDSQSHEDNIENLEESNKAIDITKNALIQCFERLIAVQKMLLQHYYKLVYESATKFVLPLTSFIDAYQLSSKNMQYCCFEDQGIFSVGEDDLSVNGGDLEDEVVLCLSQTKLRLFQTERIYQEMTDQQERLDLDLKNSVHEKEILQQKLDDAKANLIGARNKATDSGEPAIIAESFLKKNRELQEKVAKLENALVIQESQHATEFEAILFQNASLNEKLAAFESKRSNRSSENIQLDLNTTIASHIDATIDRTNNSNQTINQLKSELPGLLGSYQNLMSQSFEFEGERLRLEREIDDLRDKNEALENKLLENKINILTNHVSTREENNASSNADFERPTIATLRKEFRKIVLDMRRDHAAVLKAEYDERKRLEKIIRDMKRNLS